MSRAACALFVAHGRPVRPIIYYLHRARDGRRPKSTHALPIGSRPAKLRFEHLAWWKVRPQEVLATGSAGVLPFVVFTRGATIDHIRQAAETIGRLPISLEQRCDANAALYMLATTREQFPIDLLGVMIPKEMLMKSAGFLEAMRLGQAKLLADAKASLTRVLSARLGDVPDELRIAIERADEQAVLAALEVSGIETDRQRLFRAVQDLLPP